MKNNASSVYSLLLVVGDFFALLTAFVVAYILRVKIDPRPLIEAIPAWTYLHTFLFVLPFWILIHAFIGLYDHSIYEKRFSELGRLVVGSFIGILVVIGYNFVTNGRLFPARLVPIYGLGLGFGLLLLFRTLARGLRTLLFSYDIGINNVLIIGDTTVTDKLVDMLQDSRSSGYRIVGVVGNKKRQVDHFANFQEAIKRLKNKDVHSIIQTELYGDPNENTAILSYAQTNHISYRFVPGNTDLFVGNIDVEIFRDIPVIAVRQTALNGWGRIAKRLFDLFVGMSLIIILSPLFVFVALLNLLLSGEVFFVHTRLTRFNKPFKVIKFRSQYKKYDGTTPEEAFAKMGKPELAKIYRANGDYLADDPRVTPFGRFLRRTSLDELPQLFNVIEGSLSLVGPRALIPTELELFDKRHTILSVKSGLTGLAQVSGRRDIDFEERRKLDLFYVQNWSFWLDFVILLKTLRVVLLGEGAK